MADVFISYRRSTSAILAWRVSHGPNVAHPLRRVIESVAANAAEN